MNRAFIYSASLTTCLLLGACESNKETTIDSPSQALPAEDSLTTIIREVDPARVIQAIEKEPERYPTVYGMVKAVTPGTPADRLGVTPGALILKRANNFASRFQGMIGEGDLLWVDTNGKFHRDFVNAGTCGFFTVGIRDFTPWFVKNGNRNPRWDHDVVTALSIHLRNPEIAKQLWERAIQNGYPADSLSNLCQMNLACALGDPKAAVFHAKAFGSLESAPDGMPLWESDWQELAAVTGDYNWIANTGDYFDSKYPNNSLVNEHFDFADLQIIASQDKECQAEESPSELAKKMNRSSVLSDHNSQSPWTNNNSDVGKRQREMIRIANEARNLGQTQFEPQLLAMPPDFFHLSWTGLKEKSRNLDMSIQFTVKPIETSSPSDYMKEFNIGLVNRTMHGGEKAGVIPPSARILALAFGYDTHSAQGLSLISASIPSRLPWARISLRINPYQFGGQSLFKHIPDHRPKLSDKQTLRVVRVGNQAEAILNGKRIALVYVPPHLDDTGVCWFVSGVEVSITSLQIDVLH